MRLHCYLPTRSEDWEDVMMLFLRLLNSRKLKQIVAIFRSVLDSETKRLEAVCQDWLHIQSSTRDLPSEASGLISAAVGHTQLLLKKKFRQFNGLIDRCEKTLQVNTTEAPVMSSDLKGFWDMVCLEVKKFVA
jgi:disks large-associated protein 5